VRVEVGQVVQGRYELRRVLEVGGRSTLLEAVAREQDQFVVVEVFRRFRLAHENEPFLRELELAAALRSSHVVRVLGSGRDRDGANYVVSEPPEGESLETLLRRQGPMPLVRIVELMLQVCGALGEAHAAQLVHQDVSPETLFLTRQSDGSPCMKVRGFGARRALHAIGEGRLFEASHFTAPEQLPGVPCLDRRTDVWGLGATIYELATGRRPFEQAPQQLETALLTSEPRPLGERRPGLPAAFSDAVMRCLMRSPSARYGSISDLADALAPYGPKRSVSGTMRSVLAAGATRLRSSTGRVRDLVRHGKW
jgi:eukaryotic-like serine/threonine-protein kinase